MANNYAFTTDCMMVVLTAAYVIATCFICFFNYRAAKAAREQTLEIKRQYDAENRPYITVEMIYEKRTFFGLRFTNHGKKTANCVNIKFKQSFIDSISESSFKPLLEDQGNKKCIIGIGQHYDIYFGTKEYRNSPDKAPIIGSVFYMDGGNKYNEEFTVDIENYATFFSVNSIFEDVLSEMKKQSKQLEKISNALKISVKQEVTSTEIVTGGGSDGK